MRFYLVVTVVLSLLVTINTKRENAEARVKVDNVVVFDGIEVPDSPLILLDRVKLQRKPAVVEIARNRNRKKQEVVTSAPAVVAATQNTTVNTSQKPGEQENRRCTCSLGVCKCCTGPVLDLFNQKACMKVTYHPGDFAFDVSMSFNDRVLYENSISGKNPRPICISPPRLNNLKVCARFYDVFFPGRNFHFCLAMNGKWRSFELFDFAFDCLRMGANGIAMVKPGDGGGLPIPNPQGGVDAVIDAGDDEIEEYDENLVRSFFNAFGAEDDDDDDDDDDDYDDK